MTVFTGTATVRAQGSGLAGTGHAWFSVRRAYGVNAHVYTTVTPAKGGGLTGINFVKVFNYTVGVPTTWPGPPPGQNQPVPPGAQTLACFLPPLQPLLAGQLDAQLKTWLAQAPAGSQVTAYQEGNDPSNTFWSQPGASQANLIAMHAYLRAFCAANAPQVAYGEDFGSSPIYTKGQDCTAYAAPGLAWYSFDGYDRPKQNTAGQWVSPYTAAQVFAGLGQIRAKWPQAALAITETNTQRVTEDPASAGAWFTAVYQVAKQYNCVLYNTWWGPPGTTNTDWQKIEFTAGAPYVGALNAIAADCAA